MSAMKLDGFFHGMKFGRDLFIEHAGNDMRHHFALARRERAVARAHFGQPGPLMAGGAVALESRVDGREEFLVAERFGKKLDRTGFYRLYRHRDVTVARDEDDRYRDAGFGQLPLQVEAAQTGHSHIEH